MLGGGVIGCEYASMFASLGVRVRVVDGRPHLLPFLDEEMGERLILAMTGLGVEFHLETTAAEVRRVDGRGLVCTLTSGVELESEKLFVASGRTGNTGSLNPEAISVEVDA